jgi:hypothetical protein
MTKTKTYILKTSHNGNPIDLEVEAEDVPQAVAQVLKSLGLQVLSRVTDEVGFWRVDVSEWDGALTALGLDISEKPTKQPTKSVSKPMSKNDQH